MPDLTPELNLATAVDDDDTADYLTINLRDDLLLLDGLFSQSTGHTHDGAHQGGTLVDPFAADVTIAPDTPQLRWSFAQARLVVPNGTAYPTDPTPIDGDLFYRTDLNRLAVYDDSLAAWLTVNDLVFGTATPSTGVYVVGPNISYVFCSGTCTGVTLPDATATVRTITIRNERGAGDLAIGAAAGTVTGGSISPTTGAVLDGTISPGDSITYKSNGTNWRWV